EGRPAVVIGAGAMGALSLATLRRAGAGPLYVTNRSPERAERLAELHGAVAVPFAELPSLLERVDVGVSATASPQPVLDAPLVAGAASHKPLLLLDLALPRDVAPGVGELPGITLVDIELLSGSLSTTVDAGGRAAEDIVATEVEAFLTWLRGADVAPTV